MKNHLQKMKKKSKTFNKWKKKKLIIIKNDTE